MATTKNNTTGHIRRMKIDLTEPLKMNCDMEYREFMLMVGTNGSGKTLMLGLTWALSYITQGAVAAKVMPNAPKFEAIPFSQFVFDHSFTDQNFNGTIQCTFERGEMEVILENGRVVSVKHSGLEDIDAPMPAKFLSSNFRLFSNIRMYLKMRKMLLAEHKTMEMMMFYLTKEFKLYDVDYIESMIRNMPKEMNDESRRGLLNLLGDDDEATKIESFGVDLEECEFYAVIEGKRKNLSTYGNGHQAIFNMNMLF